MSGGFYDYREFVITEIAETFEDAISKNNEKPEYWYGDWNGQVYSDEVIEEFKKGYAILRLADAYAHRSDWLLSGDDDGEAFARRLKENLDDLIKTDKYGYIEKILESLK